MEYEDLLALSMCYNFTVKFYELILMLNIPVGVCWLLLILLWGI
jgi:hypothetical protein